MFVLGNILPGNYTIGSFVDPVTGDPTPLVALSRREQLLVVSSLSSCSQPESSSGRAKCLAGSHGVIGWVSLRSCVGFGVLLALT